MKFEVNKSTEYNKDYGIIVHNHFREFVIRISFGVYNWRIVWQKQQN